MSRRNSRVLLERMKGGVAVIDAKEVSALLEDYNGGVIVRLKSASKGIMVRGTIGEVQRKLAFSPKPKRARRRKVAA